MSARQLSRYAVAQVTMKTKTRLVVRYLVRAGWQEEIRLPDWVELLDLPGLSFVDVNCSRYHHELGSFAWEEHLQLIMAGGDTWTRAVDKGRHVENWLLGMEGSVA